MFELIVAIVAILLFYGLIKKYMSVQNEKAELWVVEQRAGLQDELKSLDDKIDSIKAKNNGKWFSITDIESKMQ